MICPHGTPKRGKGVSDAAADDPPVIIIRISRSMGVLEFAYRYVSLVRFPSSDGMVPMSLFL